MENKPKIFCIGYNKTGTTSLGATLKQIGFNVAPQIPQEKQLTETVRNGNYIPFIKFCKKYEAFQDLPFSMGNTYVQADCLFPGSKFILSIRDSEEWYKSLVNFHLRGIFKQFGLKNIKEVREGHFKNQTLWLYKNYDYEIKKTEIALLDKEYKIKYDWSMAYNKEHLISVYDNRNLEIIKYFRTRKEDLLIIDITKESDNAKILKFLGLNATAQKLPWKNRSRFKKK